MVMANGGTTSFIERCEEELKQHLTNLKGKGNQTLSVETVSAQELQQTQSLIDRMDCLTATLPFGTREKAEERLVQYRNDLKKLNERSSQFIFSVRQPSAEDSESALLKNEQQLFENNNKILEAEQVAFQSEQMGMNSLNDLKRQREQLLAAQKRLHETDSNVGHSNRLMNEMFARMNINRVLSYAVVGLLIITILLVIYYKIFG
jgi:vesicle transport through interaction with t-SNAREs protein 1